MSSMQLLAGLGNFHAIVNKYRHIKMFLELVLLQIQLCIQRLESPSEPVFILCWVLLFMWCSDCRHNTDAEFDGEFIHFVNR